MAFNFACLPRESAKAHPDKAAPVFDGGSLTFSRVDVRSGVPR